MGLNHDEIIRKNRFLSPWGIHVGEGGAGGIYPTAPEILLFVVRAAFFTEFQKFFRVVNGHAKSDFWLQRLFLIRLFFDPLKGKTPFFKGWLPEAAGIFPAWLFQLRDQIWSVWSWSCPTSKNINTLLHIFSEYRTVLSRAFSENSISDFWLKKASQNFFLLKNMLKIETFLLLANFCEGKI